jgi:hypothetical protein
MYQADEKLGKFVVLRLDRDIFKRVSIDKLDKLANKLAYQYANTHKQDYYKTQTQVLDILRRLRCRPNYYKAGS